jgi:hypothetical protein
MRQEMYLLRDQQLLATLINDFDGKNLLTSAKRDAGTSEKKAL